VSKEPFTVSPKGTVLPLYYMQAILECPCDLARRTGHFVQNDCCLGALLLHWPRVLVLPRGHLPPVHDALSLSGILRLSLVCRARFNACLLESVVSVRSHHTAGPRTATPLRRVHERQTLAMEPGAPHANAGMVRHWRVLAILLGSLSGWERLPGPVGVLPYGALSQAPRAAPL